MSIINRLYLGGPAIILFLMTSSYSYSGECENLRDIRQKSIWTRIYEYFVPDTRHVQEQKVQEDKLKDLDGQLNKVNDLKLELLKTESELSTLRKELDKIKEDPLMKLYDFSLCALRYQKAYDKDRKPFNPNARSVLEGISHEDDNFITMDNHRTFGIQKLPDVVYDPENELQKHSTAYKAADCILASGEKLVKAVMDTSNLPDGVRTGYEEQMSDAILAYRDLKYYDYANRLGDMGNQLIVYYNKEKFNELMDRKKKVTKLIASLEKTRSDIRIQYDLTSNIVYGRLGTVIEAIKTLRENLGLEVGPQCLVNLSKFCTIRNNTSDYTCGIITRAMSSFNSANSVNSKSSIN